jgi:hypothetical protein
VSSPSVHCLPKPSDNDPFYQELIDRGVYYRSVTDDGYMWNVTLPPGWGFLKGETSTTYHGGYVEEGMVIDENGYYVAKVIAQSSGNDRKESAYASISRTSGKIDVKWTVNDFGYVVLDKDDLLREEQEKQKREEDMKKRLEDAEKMRKYQILVSRHNENVSRYRSCANNYKTRLTSLSSSGSTDYEKYSKIYSNNLETEYKELVKSADQLGLSHPNKINLTL